MKTFLSFQRPDFVNCTIRRNNAHFLKEEAYRNQVAQDFRTEKTAAP